MNIQQSLINRYKKFFPQDTFKIISKKTKIQQTRVFRIFNGAEMRISELEAFEEVMSASNNIKIQEFINLSKKCTSNLSERVLNDLYTQMRLLLKTKYLVTN
jgi:hypothetical protein